jgi:hypothetical protein
MRKQSYIAVCAVVVLGVALGAFARQGAAPAAPGKTPKSTTLLFREDFKTGKVGEVQLNQDAITNPNLQLKLYGPGSKPGDADQSGLLLSNEADPTVPGTTESIVWTGVVQGNWAVLLKDKNNFLNLNDTARLRWRIRPRGFHELRPVIKLADGTMLAADYSEPTSTYMRVSEIYFVDISRWRPLNPDTVAEARAKPGEGLWKYNVDLSKVDEIGFTDMMAGAGHGAQGNIAVDWIEVYGNPVPRGTAQSELH